MGIDGAVFFPRDAYAGVKKLFEQFHARDAFVVELTRIGSDR